MSRTPGPLRADAKAALADPWFHVCLSEAIDTWELVEQFDRLYGAGLTAKRAPIERMVDKATGALDNDCAAFVEFVYDFVYTRLPHPLLPAEPTAPQGEGRRPR